MKITCHSCAAKYTVSDEKVQGKTVKMKCRKCGATIVVGGSASPGEGAVAGDDAGVDLPAGSYLVNVTEGDQRTMQLAEIVDAYNQGVVTGDTYVWADGMADWQALSENDAIVAALNAAAGGGAPASGGAAAYGGTNGTNGNHAYDAPAPYAAPAAPAGGYGGDVFGGTPAFAASAEAARPAAARKDAGRKSGDLFGGGGGGYDSPGMGAAAAVSSPGTGKRDENSVLFSLSALTSTSGPPSRPVGATTATKEDSGLIDLKALAASATPAPAAAPAAPAIDAVGLFPLGAPVVAPAPAPMQMVGPASMAAPQKRSPLPLILGGVVAVAAIVGVFFVVRGAGEQAPTATAAANTAPPPPTATATETAAATTAAPTAEATSDATAEASASASAAPIAAKGGGYKGGGKGGTKGGTTAAPPSTGGGSKPPPAAGKGPCSHCGSDLHCAMKCSAGKK